MKKALFIFIAVISFAISVSAQDSCTVYGGTEGNKVTLQKSSVRLSSGFVSVYLSKPEKKDVYVNIRVTRDKDGAEEVKQICIPKGQTKGEFDGSIDGLVEDYHFSIDDSSCR